MAPSPELNLRAARRRRALLAALRTAVSGLLPAGLADRRAAGASRVAPDDRPDPLDPLQLAPGVHVLRGLNAPPDAANQGRVGNLGFVVGSEAIVLIDTGSSRARAAELLAAVRQVSALPLRAVLITHPAQEFLFGIELYQALGVAVVAHPLTPRMMAQRCEHCLETLNRELGTARMAGTRLVLPEALMLPPPPIELGGRSLHVRAGPAGTAPGNLMAFDAASGVLFTGALLSVRRIPGLQDTRPRDWKAALAALDDPAVRIAVPAWGPVAARDPLPDQVALDQAKADLGDYLEALEQQARSLYRDQVPLAELAAHASLPQFAGWNGYPASHVHNIFYRYLQLEAEDLSSN